LRLQKTLEEGAEIITVSARTQGGDPFAPSQERERFTAIHTRVSKTFHIHMRNKETKSPDFIPISIVLSSARAPIGNQQFGATSLFKKL